jgi:hypothetical protein
MNWKNYKEYKVHLLLAFVAAIFVTYCFEPIVNLLSRFFIYISVAISSTFLDSLYKDIARGKTDYALGVMSMLLLLIPLGMFSTYLLMIRSKEKNKENKIEKLVKAKTQLSFGSAWIKPLFNFVVSISFIVMIILIVVSGNIKYSTILTFEQQIKILTPYINTNEKDLLISKFASMQNYSDYQEIINQVNKFAKEKNIILPVQSYLLTY